MASTGFVSHVDDMPSASGYAFRFHCDRCPRSYEIAPKAKGLKERVLRAAVQRLGGAAKEASEVLSEVRVGSPEYRAAREAATAEAAALFEHCSGCSKWVCKEACWNAKARRCETCSPNLEEEAAVRQMRELDRRAAERKAAEDAAYDRAAVAKVPAATVAASAGASCPKCGAAGRSGRFCNVCGAPLVLAPPACGACGAGQEAGARFCNACGKPLAG